MENINKETYSSDIKLYIFSILGTIIFFIPIRIDNQYDTLIYHISYFVDNRLSSIVNISIISFVLLSILKRIYNGGLWNKNYLSIGIRIFSFVILISILLGKQDVFFVSDDFIFILKDLILDLTILLPVSSIFMPLILEYGLLEIVESYTHGMMKSLFKVSGRVFLNFLIYLLVNNVCGAFMTYRLYKDGKLRENEAAITILSFSILSLTLTRDLCYKLNINIVNFFLLEILVLVICNFIISRIYPLKKKKKSYYFKSNNKNVNCRTNKIKNAIKKYHMNKSNKNIISLSISYFNDAIYIVMEILPKIILLFFIFDIIYHIPSIMEIINNSLYMTISYINIPNAMLIAETVNLNLFSSILAIENIAKDSYYISKITIGLFITLQCFSICFLLPFIDRSILNLKFREIVLVVMERFFIILGISFIIYSLYIKYLI